MKELSVGNTSNAFGTDVGWPFEKVDGHFIRFVPFSRFRVQNWEYNNTVNIDRWGGRVVKTRQSGNGNDEKIIPFLGDSFCFGVGVEDSQTYVSLLDSPVSHRYINLGVPGSALPNHLDIIEHRHEDLHAPRLYMFTFFLGNDFRDIVSYYEVGQRRDSRDQERSNQSTTLEYIVTTLNYLANDNSLFKRSYLAQFFRQKLILIYNHSRAEKLVDPIFLTMQGNQEYRDKVDRSLDLTIKRLFQLSRRLGFSAVFIIIPDRHQIDHAVLQSKATYYGFKFGDLDANLPNKIIQEKLRTVGIPYIDATSCLASKRDIYYVRDNHLNEAGHKAVADCISTELNHFVLSYYAEHFPSEKNSATQSSPNDYSAGKVYPGRGTETGSLASVSPIHAE